MVLSQPTSSTIASRQWPLTASSIESAMVSREASEARMPSRAHRDAVGDGDGVELDRRAAGVEHAGAHVLRQVAQGEVARRHVGPGVDDGDQRLRDRGVVQSGGAQHRACRGAGGALLDGVASHDWTVPVGWKPRPQKQKPRAVSGAGSCVSDLGGVVLLTQTRTPALVCPVISTSTRMSAADAVRVNASRSDSTVPCGRA